jgi:hypothetical protein
MAGISTRNKTLYVGLEATAGSKDGDGIPQEPADVYRLEARNVAGLETPGEYELETEEDAAVDGAHGVPPTVLSRFDDAGGEHFGRRGDFTVEFVIRSQADGAEVATYDELAAYILLQSSLAVSSDPGGGTTESPSDGDGANTFDATDATKYKVGNLFGVVQGGRLYASAVTDITVAVIKHSPALPAAIDETMTVRQMRTLFTATGAYLGSTGKTAYCRLDTAGTRTQAFMCRARQIKCTFPNGRLARWSVTMFSPWIVDDHANAADPGAASDACNDGEKWRLAGCPRISSSAAPSCGGVVAALGGTNIPVIPSTLELEINFTLDDDEDVQSCNDLTTIPGAPEVLTSETIIRGELNVKNTDFATIAQSEERRSFVVTFGPGGEGEGGAFYVPAAYFTTVPTASVAKSKVTTPFEMRAGRFAGDDGTPSATNASNSETRIGLTLKAA